MSNPLIVVVIALVLSGCAAAGYVTSGVGAARSEIRFMDLEERLKVVEDRLCRK